MQPYFFPYINYFNLIKKSDIFVILDDVQFPRRGWVHRNKFFDYHGTLRYHTLSTIHTNQNAKVNEIQLHANFIDNNKLAVRKFPIWSQISQIQNFDYLFNNYFNNLEALVSHSILHMLEVLDIQTQIFTSSSLELDKSLTGQERIISIVKYFESKTYLNLPGGVGYYEYDKFRMNGINLNFLDKLVGEQPSVLELLYRKMSS